MIAPSLEALKAHKQFILYRFSPSQTRHGKLDKFPCNRSGNIVSALDPMYWMSAEEAERSAQQLGNQYGIGFILTPSAKIFCLDIDNCLQEDGQWSKLAFDLCAMFPGAAIEVSISGRGLHIWGSYVGNIPMHSCKNNKLGIELYTDKRFIALGRLDCAIGNVATDCTPFLHTAIGVYFSSDAAQLAAQPWTDAPDPAWRGPNNDDELINRALLSHSPNSAFGSKASFADLWNANTEVLAKCYPDPARQFDASSVDAALAQHLAFWTGKNCERIRRIMYNSKLVRDKWERPDYLERTILGVVARQFEVLTDRSIEAATAQTNEVLANNFLEVIVARADSIVTKPITWLWLNWLAKGKLHILAGAPGTGKTTLALSLAAIITRGASWPDGITANIGDVLIWSGEDDPGDTLIPRLKAMNADLAHIHFILGVSDGKNRRAFDPANDIAELAKKIRDIKPAFLIIDSIVSAVAGDSHKNNETRRALQPLVDLAAEAGVALFGISHFSKGTAGRDPLERVTGSLAFGAMARIVLAAAKLPEEKNGGRIFCRVKSNIGPDNGGFKYDVEQIHIIQGHPASKIIWKETVDQTARELLAEANTSGAEQQSALDDAKDFLIEILTIGPLLKKEIDRQARDAGHSIRTIQRAQQALGVKAIKDGFKGAWLWQLPPKMANNAQDSQSKSVDTLGEFGDLEIPRIISKEI